MTGAGDAAALALGVEGGCVVVDGSAEGSVPGYCGQCLSSLPHSLEDDSTRTVVRYDVLAAQDSLLDPGNGMSCMMVSRHRCERGSFIRWGDIPVYQDVPTKALGRVWEVSQDGRDASSGRFIAHP